MFDINDTQTVSLYETICGLDEYSNCSIVLDGKFYGVEAGTVVAIPLYYQEEDNGV